MDLKDKKVIVTGGASGIGHKLVESFLEQGAIVGIFDIDKQRLESLSKNNPNTFCIKCDVADYTQVVTCVNKFYEQYNEINILVNNAGILYSEPLISFSPSGIKKHDLESWHKVIGVDLNSVFYVTVNVVEKMIQKRTKGVIVNISSICSAGNAGQSAYSAAKAGVNALTATWSKELGIWGIRVLGIAPGFFDTESTRKVMSDSALNEVIKEISLRRLGKIEEITDGIIAIIKNEYFNGKVFELDGGLFM